MSRTIWILAGFVLALAFTVTVARATAPPSGQVLGHQQIYILDSSGDPQAVTDGSTPVPVEGDIDVTPATGTQWSTADILWTPVDYPEYEVETLTTATLACIPAGNRSQIAFSNLTGNDITYRWTTATDCQCDPAGVGETCTELTSNTSSSVAPGLLYDVTQAWVLESGAGLHLLDSAGTDHPTTSYENDTVTITAGATVPAAGAYEIVQEEVGYSSWTPASVDTLRLWDYDAAWTVNEWAGDTLVDSAAAEYTIASNTTKTITVAGAATPAAGAYEVRAQYNGALGDFTTYTPAAVSADTMVDPTANWTADAYAGMHIFDSTGAIEDIVSNTTNVLTLDAVAAPNAGAFTVFDEVTGLTTYTPTAVGAGQLLDITKSWTADAYAGDVLIDSAATKFDITANSSNLLTLDSVATPATGAYTINNIPTGYETWTPLWTDVGWVAGPSGVTVCPTVTDWYVVDSVTDTLYDVTGCSTSADPVDHIRLAHAGGVEITNPVYVLHQIETGTGASAVEAGEVAVPLAMAGFCADGLTGVTGWIVYDVAGSASYDVTGCSENVLTHDGAAVTLAGDAFVYTIQATGTAAAASAGAVVVPHAAIGFCAAGSSPDLTGWRLYDVETSLDYAVTSCRDAVLFHDGAAVTFGGDAYVYTVDASGTSAGAGSDYVAVPPALWPFCVGATDVTGWYIRDESAGASYTVTGCSENALEHSGAATAAGTVYAYQVLETGTSTITAPAEYHDKAATWVVDAYAGKWLYDGTGTYTIVSNTGTALTLTSGTALEGAYQIVEPLAQITAADADVKTMGAQALYSADSGWSMIALPVASGDLQITRGEGLALPGVEEVTAHQGSAGLVTDPWSTRLSDGADALSTPIHGTAAGTELFTLATSPVYQDALDATQARQIEAYGMGVTFALPTLIGIGVTDDPEAPRVMESEPGLLAAGLVTRQAGEADVRLMDGFGEEIWSDEVIDTGAEAIGAITCAAAADIADSGDYVSMTGVDGTERVFEFDKDASGATISGATVVDISGAITATEVATVLDTAITTQAYFTASRLDEVITVTQPTRGTAGNNAITTNNVSTTVTGFSGGVEIEYALAVVDREAIELLEDIDAKLDQTTCEPDLSTDEECLEACLADGSVTASIPAGDYMLSVFGETTWVKTGATLATGGTRYVPGTQIPVTVSATADYACRSSGGTGDVCFVPCL